MAFTEPDVKKRGDRSPAMSRGDGDAKLSSPSSPSSRFLFLLMQTPSMKSKAPAKLTAAIVAVRLRGDVGIDVGADVGIDVGADVGISDGLIDGRREGLSDGEIDGNRLGAGLGLNDGKSDGATLGTRVGEEDGVCDGLDVGFIVGASVSSRINVGPASLTLTPAWFILVTSASGFELM